MSGPTKAVVEQAVRDSRLLITTIHGRLAVVYFADSALVPSPKEIRQALRAVSVAQRAAK